MEENTKNNITQKVPPDYGQSAINILQVLANIVLVCGIIGAISIWATLGMIQDPEYQAISVKIANPTGIILGFEILFFSVITYAFLNVVCGIAQNIIVIRKNLEK